MIPVANIFVAFSSCDYDREAQRMSASTRNRPWAFDAELIKRNLSELKSVYHPGVRNSEVKIQEEIEAAHRK